MNEATGDNTLARMLGHDGLDGLIPAFGGPKLYTALIRYEKQSLPVATDDERALIWAKAYLEPILTMTDGPEADVGGPESARYVALSVSPARLESLVASLPWADTDLVIHSTKRARIARLPGHTCVHDTADAVLYVIERDTGRVVSLGVPSPVNLRDLARQSRELLLGGLLADGWLVLHASAVARDGRAWIFAGNKGSGKTTLALALLSSGGNFAYVANDRLLARADPAGRVELRPYAISVRLGGGTVRNHPLLRPHLHCFDHFNAAVLPLDQQFSHDDKLELTVREYSKIVGFGVAGNAVLDRVVFPSIDVGAAGSSPGTGRVEVPDPRQVHELLTACLLIPDPEGTGWLRGLTGAEDTFTEPMRNTLLAMARTGALRLRGTPDEIISAVLRPDASAGPTAQLPAATAGPAWDRAPLNASMVAVTDHRRADRALTLSRWRTRAVPAGHVHELLLVSADADLAGPVDRVAYLGFATFESGLLAVGDTLSWRGQPVARLAGFDDTHLPNHMNVVLQAFGTEMTGCELGLRPGDAVIFEPRP